MRLALSCIAVALLSACSTLPREQMIYESTYQVLHAIDAVQTMNIDLRRDYRRGRHVYEGNPILGKYPKDSEVLAYMAGEAALHFGITKLLADRGAPVAVQRLWHYTSIGWNGRLVIRNRKMGL
jgi:hypothetical protein